MARVLAVPAVVLVLAGGFYLISRNVPTGGLVAIGAGVAWVVVAGAAAAWLARRDNVLLRLVLGSALLVAVVGGFLIAPKPSEVDETVVTAAPQRMADDHAGEAAQRAARQPGASPARAATAGRAGPRW